jgi:hypothetical protein
MKSELALDEAALRALWDMLQGASLLQEDGSLRLNYDVFCQARMRCAPQACKICAAIYPARACIVATCQCAREYVLRCLQVGTRAREMFGKAVDGFFRPSTYARFAQVRQSACAGGAVRLLWTMRCAFDLQDAQKEAS